MANTAALRAWLEREQGLQLADYEALRRWSVAHIDEFWAAMWRWFDVQSPTPYARITEGRTMPGVRWFPGARVNYAAQALRHAATCDAAGLPAIVFRNERLQAEGRSVEIGWGELADQVARFAASLRACGVGHGDRVAAYLPNIPQTIVAFLACASLGAIWSVTAPDMGVGTVRDRFAQIEPKVLIACDGSVYGGKTTDRRGTVAALLKALPSVQTLVLLPYLAQAGAADADADADADVRPFDAAGWTGTIRSWEQMLDTGQRVEPASVDFEHPLWIVYSSGTTGMPKPIVHGHGGAMMQLMKESRLHLDLHPSVEFGERFFWYSSTGWIMWNVSVSSLLGGTTTCLYDGHPAHPRADELWRFAEAAKVSFFGAGAAYYAGCLKAGVSPKAWLRAPQLRTLGATGSPLSPEAYLWGYEQVRSDLWWAVISGGTDVAGAFLGGTPELPTVPGRMQARTLATDVHAWDEAGRPLIDEVGELVCTQPMPSMPLFFWGDRDGSRYRESYFDVYPGVWRHGDWLRITPDGGAVIHGRSDATLNRHGHRLGTSEIYRAVEAVPEVLDSLVFDIEVPGQPSFMPLFVVLRPGLALDEPIRARIVDAIREGVSPRFVPDQIVQVQEVPRTLTGKKQELPVKRLLLGRALDEVVNKDACANPQAFDFFVDWARQRRTKD